MSSEFIRSVTESDFEYEVIAYSQNTPVVVYFWADWCKPCKVLTPMLEKFAREASGEFRLAKVDVDVNPNLVMRYSVRTIPTVIAFSQAKKVADFAGLMPESRVHEFLDRILPPSPSSLLAQKGQSLLAAGEVDDAEQVFAEALKLDAEHPASLLGLMKICVLRGQPDMAFGIYETFPASLEFNEAERLLPLVKVMKAMQDNELPQVTDLDAAFSNSIRLVARGNIYAGIDGLLDLLRQDKRYRKGKAREVVIALFDLLDPESEKTRTYRSELASILF